MKVLFLLIICVTSVLCQIYTNTDGRPGCKTNGELERFWRNNFDATLYWECRKKNIKGVKMICPVGFMFLDSAQNCVLPEDWEWTSPYDPPSK